MHTQPAAAAGALSDAQLDFLATTTPEASTPPTTVAASDAPQTTIIQQPIIERIVERTVPASAASGISEQTLAGRLASLKDDLLLRIAAVASAPIVFSGPAPTTPVSTATFAPSQRIDQLTNTSINTPTITGGTISGANVSGYLPLSGGTITGALSGTELNLSGSLTAGTLTVAGLSSGGALFAPYFSATSTTATSTFAGGINASYASSTGGLFNTLTVGSLALTTPLSAENGGTGISNPSAGGTLIGSFTGGAWQQIATSSLGLLSTNVAEGSNLYFTNARADARINATSTIGTLTSAPNLATISTTLTGFLKATAGALSTALIDLASDVTGVLPVNRGGTGWAALASGAIPYGDGTNAVATTSAGTAGQVLALLNGVPTWTATTTFSAPLSYANGAVSLAQANSSTNGYLASADWMLFNNKIASSSLSATFPLAYNSATGMFTTAFGTTTGNSFNQLQQFNANASTSALTVTGNTYFPGSSIWRSDGNVGIGTTDPEQLLQVGNQDGVRAGVSGAASSIYLGSAFDTEGDSKISYDRSTGAFTFSNGSNPSTYTERFRITATGNVGIGTTTPSRLLTLSSAGSPELGIMSTDASSRLWTLQSSSGAGALPGTFQIIDRTANASRLLIDTLGNVGVGQTNPEYKLDVAAADLGTTAGSSSSMLRLYSYSGNGDFLRFYNYRTANGSAHTTSEQRIQRTIDVTDMGYIGLGSNYLALAGNGTENLRITATGNVGIGTTTPAVKLHVAGDSVGSISINTPSMDASAYTPSGVGAFAIRQGSALTDNSLLFGVSSSAGNSWIQSVDAGSQYLPLSLNPSGGNVGIGTTTPWGKLSVTGSGTGTGLAFAVADSANTPQFVIQDNGNVGIGTNGPLNILDVAGGAVVGSGFSGVVTAPTNGLVVQGSAAFGTNSSNGYGFQVNSNTSNFYATSTPTTAATAQQVTIGEATNNPLYRLSLGFFNNSGTYNSVLQSTNAGSGSALLLNPSGGNVGIGTTTPQGKLTVSGVGNNTRYFANGSSTDAALILEDTGNATEYGGQLFFGSRYGLMAGIKGALRNAAGPAGDLVFQTRAITGDILERMTILWNGNVGIGTTTPDAKLHIAGQAHIGDAGAASFLLNLGSVGVGGYRSGYLYGDGTNILLLNQQAGALQFGTNNTEYMRIDSSGNVGIGTTTPQRPLDVNGSIRIASGSVLEFGQTAAKNYIASTDAGNYLAFGTNAAERLRITSSGGIGIGTTSPNTKLQISGSTGLKVENGTTDSGVITLGDTTSGLSGSGVYLARGLQTGVLSSALNLGGYGGFTFNTLDTPSSPGTPKLVITSTGNVGIGTTTPSRVLTAFSSTAPQLSLSAGAGSNEWTFRNAGGVLYIATSTYSATSSVSAFTLDANGNLTIVGSATTCTIGNGTSATSCSSSDERLKDDVTPLAVESGLAAIQALNPVSFHWNSWMQSVGNASSTQFGLIAQQVQSVFPNLVQEDANTHYYKLDYQGLIAPMIKAIQEIASISGAFKTNLIAWLGSASNGIGDLFAKDIYATNGTFNRVTAQALCAEDICVTRDQLAAVLAVIGQTSGSPSANAPEGTPQAPVIELNGNASSTIDIGDTYNDLGARIVAPESDLNLGIVVLLDGATTTASIDTTTPGEHTILYTVTSPTTGLTSTIMRTVTVSPVEQSLEPQAIDNPFNAPPSNDNASSTTAVDTAA